MRTRPPEVAATWVARLSARAKTVREDQQGAIMVLGIFMCSCIAGLLWYVAGLGDAIVYRERMQEAADAVAFSGAVLHARGMNLIVLINLLMAVVLAIRVALKMLILALTIATVIFGIIGLIPFCCQWALGIADVTGQAASRIQDVLDEIDPIIDEILVALHELETVIARVVPPAAIAGSWQVAEKYKPPVKEGAGAAVDEVANGLPVEDGTEDMLCGKAGEAAAMVIAWPLEKIGLGKGASMFEGFMSKIARAGSGYFCEMGSGGNAPDLDSIYDDQAKDTCSKRQEQMQIDYNKLTTDWHTACSKTNPPASCMDPDPFTNETSMTYDETKLTLSEISNLKSLAAKVDAKYQDIKNFEDEKCQKDEKKNMKEKTEVPESKNSSSNSGNKKPMMTKKDYKNGVKNSQFMSLIYGETDFLGAGPRGVKVGAFKDRRVKEPAEPKSANISFAQAEFFYDCSGEWDTGSCNNEGGTHESAMWHFKWRARLRRYNAPNSYFDTALKLAVGEYGINAARFIPGMRFSGIGNSKLRLEIADAAKSSISDAKNNLVFH